jgi:hypothetical protein
MQLHAHTRRLHDIFNALCECRARCFPTEQI